MAKFLFSFIISTLAMPVLSQSTQPNILFIVADDMGAWTLSANGNANNSTPELDRLANQGALFTNAFSVSVVCSPSRAALISGRYPSETGVLDVLSNESESALDTTLTLWPELLKEDGYQTALVGKWHLGDTKESLYPENRGYSKFSGFLHGGLVSMSPTVRLEGKDTVYENKYTPDVLTDLTMGYINDFKKGPWAISLHFWAPHANTRFPKGFSPPYDDRSWLPMQDKDMVHWNNLKIKLPEPDFPNLNTERTERMMREYLSSVHSVDRNVGRILKFLEELNLDNNTIVIFTSDHGYMMGHHGLWHKGNGRWLTYDEKDPSGIYDGNRPNMYDNSLKVPLIIKWPGKILPNSRQTRVITFLDIYPTILEMANIEKPANLLLRGNSIVPLLNGRATDWDDSFYGQYKSLRCIRTENWKFIFHNSDPKLDELYSLSKDKNEHENLINSNDKYVLEKKDELKGLLIQKMKEIGDTITIK